MRKTLTLRQMATNALLGLKRELTPHPLPVAQLMGWLEDEIDEDNRVAALTFLNSYIARNQHEPFGPGMLDKIKMFIDLANDDTIMVETPAPAMSPVDLQMLVVNENAPKVVDPAEPQAEAGAEPEDDVVAEGGSETTDDTQPVAPADPGLDSFVTTRPLVHR
ncbi:MAG: hypothetical protein AAFQ58_19215 [Pseudomonadota bacterium]